MEEITCHRCGLVNDYEIAIAGPNVKKETFLPQFTASACMWCSSEQADEVCPKLVALGWEEQPAKVFMPGKAEQKLLLVLNWCSEPGWFAFADETIETGPNNGPILPYYMPDLLLAIAGQQKPGKGQIMPGQWYANQGKLLKVEKADSFKVQGLTTSGRPKFVTLVKFQEDWHHATAEEMLEGWPAEEQVPTSRKCWAVELSNGTVHEFALPEGVHVVAFRPPMAQ